MASLDQTSLDAARAREALSQPRLDAVSIRSLTLADCAAYQQFVGRLDRNDLRLRFAGAINFSADELCGRFLDIDHDLQEAFAAVDAAGAILGVGRMYRLSASEADIAIIVRSDHKRQGIGRLLLAWLREHAPRAGIAPLRADILRENDAMLQLARQFGFRSSGAAGIMAEVQLDLMPPGGPPEVARAAARTCSFPW